MNILIGMLYAVEVVTCLLLVLVVMLQKPKEGGLGGVIGGSMGEAVFGADAGNVLIKVTIWLGAIFLVNTLILARLTSTIHTKSIMVNETAPVQQPAMPDMPEMPAAPAPATPAAAPAPAPAAKPAAPAPAAKPAAPTAKPAAPAPAPAAKPAAPAPAPAAKPAAAPAKPAVPAPAAKPAAPAPAPAKK